VPLAPFPLTPGRRPGPGRPDWPPPATPGASPVSQRGREEGDGDFAKNPFPFPLFLKETFHSFAFLQKHPHL